jgi:hypothetical protein
MYLALLIGTERAMDAGVNAAALLSRKDPTKAFDVNFIFLVLLCIL